MVEDATSVRRLDEAVKREISGKLHVPLSSVESVSSFYSESKGSRQICNGLPCRLKTNGEKSVDLAEGTYATCLGYCDHAPVERVNGRYMRWVGNELVEIDQSTAGYVKEHRQGIFSYIEDGGYSALEELIGSDDDSYILEKIEAAELSGMGGAGFPTHLKWKSFRKSKEGESFLLVNGHEGEPGTYKDREILEIRPHTLLEGALISALANGVSRIIIGLKKEYSNAYESLKTGIEEMEERFGNHILRDVLPQIEIIRLGGFYVTGEETALIEAIEGKRSEPRPRPPFPTEYGILGRPTLVHNVETLSVIPEIVRMSNGKFRKTYCLSGDIDRSGTFREYTGSSVSDLIRNYGNTDPGTIKAFLPGGLSGGILPASYLEEKLDGGFSRRTGASTGTGAMVALARNRCIVDVTSAVEDFFSGESCGKCGPCRMGTLEISRLLHDLKAGHATLNELAYGRDIAESMVKGSMCALGQAAGKLFLDAARHFGNEFVDHVEGRCSTGTCGMEGGSR